MTVYVTSFLNKLQKGPLLTSFHWCKTSHHTDAYYWHPHSQAQYYSDQPLLTLYYQGHVLFRPSHRDALLLRFSHWGPAISDTLPQGPAIMSSQYNQISLEPYQGDTVLL